MRDQVCDHAVMGWSGSLEQGSSAVALVAAAAEGESKRWRHGAKHRTGRRASGSVFGPARAASLCSSVEAIAHPSMASRGNSERRTDKTKIRRRGKAGGRHANGDKALAASRCSQFPLMLPISGGRGEGVGRPGGASMQGAFKGPPMRAACSAMWEGVPGGETSAGPQSSWPFSIKCWPFSIKIAALGAQQPKSQLGGNAAMQPGSAHTLLLTF